MAITDPAGHKQGLCGLASSMISPPYPGGLAEANREALPCFRVSPGLEIKRSMLGPRLDGLIEHVGEIMPSHKVARTLDLFA